MTEDDIEFMAMGIPDAQAALAGGSVDGLFLQVRLPTIWKKTDFM